MTDHTIPDTSTRQGWRKSSYSGPEGGSCVEVLNSYPSGVRVRDSKTPYAKVLIFSTDSWKKFIATMQPADTETSNLF
ncbi:MULTISPECIES: DUF397 domain-containing protein [Streptomyces]|uniref:DUF397 domain-containing protein n=1 Tax=Streptomyces TaxID=1883 RepID=UPI00099BDE23|nr:MULTISPECIES: DUF397 domain-containing protein [Streptomyces]QEV12334.1 DUF397 domain-containing protein [Streptomyces fradiae ATCC 10745 = DSM 40063]